MLEELRCFVNVAKCGSFSATAHAQEEAVSTVTRRVTRLEQELGVELFVRSTQSLRLTADGTRLLEHAHGLLSQEEELRRSMSAPRLDCAIPLRVSAFQSFGQRVVLPVVQGFLLRYPQVRIDLELENRPVDLAREGVDLAIRIGKPQDASLKMRRLLRHDMVLCASPGYLRKYGQPEHPQELLEHNCLVFRRDKKVSHWHFRRGEMHHRVKVSGNLRSVGGGPLVECAKAGLGIILMTRWGVSTELETGSLEELLPGWTPALRASGGEEVFALFSGQKSHPARGPFLEELVRRCAEIG